MSVKRSWSGMIVLAALAGSAAQAQTNIDVAKITCEQFVLVKVVSPDFLAIWLSGYYNGKSNSATVDVQQLKENTKKIKQYCIYTKDNKVTLMEVIEKVLSQKK